MKQRTSFILKGLISLVLSLVMLCGTAVTSLSAVTVDLAETGALTPVTGNLDTTKEYYLCSENYTIEYSSGGWIVKNNSNNYIIEVNNAGPLWGTKTAAKKFSPTPNGTKFYFEYNGNYLTYSNNSLGSTTMYQMRQPLDVYEKSSATGYTVSFNGNGGTGSMSAVPNVSGSYTLPSNGFSAPTNKSFAGWKANNSGDTLAAGASYTVNADVTFYAQWTESGSTPSDPTEAPSEPSTEPSTGDGSITYKKQIEKKYPTDENDYNYRLHLTADGSKLKETTTTTSNKTVGIAIMVDMAGDQSATWGGSTRKRDIICAYLNKYLSDYKNVNNVNISIIAVKGSQSQPYNDSSVTNILSAWDNYAEISNETYTSNTITYGANYTAGLIRAQEYLTDKAKNGNKTFDYNSIVFITNQNPLFGALDNGNYDSSQGTGSEGFAKNNVLSYLDRVFIPNYTTNLHIIDVPNESSGNHTTPVAMSDKLIAAGRGTFTSATSASALDTAIGNAIESILAGDKTKNLTVTDTLSDSVAFANNVNLTATLYTGTNLATTTNVSDAVTISGKTVTFNQANVTNFSEIDGPFKLEITFDIKTTAVGQNYTNTGDPDTDYSSDTYKHNYSAGKPGYYSNSSATISYNLNGTTKSGTFIRPVVQAPAQAPVMGKYVFKYIDREKNERTVVVPVELNAKEISGYVGNDNKPGVPTYLWSSAIKAVYSDDSNAKSPFVTAALRVKGNLDDAQKDVSVYKTNLNWGEIDITDLSQNNKISVSETDHSVTVTASSEEKTFTFKYQLMKDGETLREGATQVPYGRAVTFNPTYSDPNKYAYINETIPSDGFLYWSADEAGTIPLTTNLTFGMLLRGNYTDDKDEEEIAYAYAQYGESKLDKDWYPLIEEAKLTHTVEDDGAGNKINWVYADYMTNYFSKDGKVVRDIIATNPQNHGYQYGLFVMKYDTGDSTVSLAKGDMEKYTKALISKYHTDSSKTSAYIKNKQHVGYLYEYSNNDQISNFNRVLYTLKANTEKVQGKSFAAIAYITPDNGQTYYFSEVNNDIVIHDNLTF